jgi:hypothetical protein
LVFKFIFFSHQLRVAPQSASSEINLIALPAESPLTSVNCGQTVGPITTT